MSEKKYILVVEDDMAYASVYKRKLEAEGFDVLVVNDGEAALQAVKQRKPDLIILDLLMPKKDGFTVLVELKNSADTRNVPVLVATNLSQEVDVDKAMKAGAADYFVKSNISISEVIEKIRKYLV